MTDTATEPEVLTFSFGDAPEELILERLQAQGKHYSMELVGEVAEIVEEIVNIGIDSHLEACYFPDRGDYYGWEIRKGPLKVRILKCLVTPASMPVLLRRLEEDDRDEAVSLRQDVLRTLNIEEV